MKAVRLAAVVGSALPLLLVSIFPFGLALALTNAVLLAAFSITLLLMTPRRRQPQPGWLLVALIAVPVSIPSSAAMWAAQEGRAAAFDGVMAGPAIYWSTAFLLMSFAIGLAAMNVVRHLAASGEPDKLTT